MLVVAPGFADRASGHEFTCCPAWECLQASRLAAVHSWKLAAQALKLAVDPTHCQLYALAER